MNGPAWHGSVNDENDKTSDMDRNSVCSYWWKTSRIIMAAMMVGGGGGGDNCGGGVATGDENHDADGLDKNSDGEWGVGDDGRCKAVGGVEKDSVHPTDLHANKH